MNASRIFKTIFPLALAAIAMIGSAARAEIKTETVNYEDGGVKLRGFVAYDDSLTGKRPGILVFPEWWGLTQYPKDRCQQLAKLGYVAFAADVYGDGKAAATSDEAGKLSGEFMQDREKTRARAHAALEQLKQRPDVDGSKIAAIGYCFGGMCVLEMARSGEDLSAVVAFHGALANPHPDQDKPIKAKVLICTGADDAFVPPTAVDAFEDEMKKIGANYQINVYSGAVHAFTNPDAGKANMKNVAYNEQADHRSWEAMRNLFDEVFGRAK